MPSTADVSSRLGEYMLKGWVLTDQSCPTPACVVPLMRSPSGRTPVVHFCANCNDSPDGAPPITNPRNLIITADSSSSVSSDSHISRSSTPPTDVSSTLSSPVFAPPAETEESIRRREQSDRASSEIGKRLLKGWAMLGDECPNSRCYGVPLVRPPRPGGRKDPKKECVICGSVYITGADWTGQERLILADSDTSKPYINGTNIPSSRDKGKGQEDTPHASEETLPLPELQTASTAWNDNLSLSHPPRFENYLGGGSEIIALEKSSQALQSSLHALSTRLTSISNTQATLDPASIGSTADAISKVTQALSDVRQLQWREKQAKLL